MSLNKLATIEQISEVTDHPEADRLSLVKVAGYTAIVPKDKYKGGEIVGFVHPDTCLPNLPWAEPYKKYAEKRVKVCKIRGIFSQGIIVDLPEISSLIPYWENVGDEISEFIGVTKYVYPEIQELNAKGNLPFGIFRTDEQRHNNFRNGPPYGELVDLTVKLDGSSASYFCKKINDEWVTGICSRSLEIKPECSNNYTAANKKHNILDKLLAFCKGNNKSLCLRGEVYGNGIQGFPSNPHAKLPLDWACFSVLDLDTLEYHRRDSDLYFIKLCAQLNLPTVPIIEEGVVLTRELIEKYTQMEKLDGKLFEGVVMNTNKLSFKVLSLAYDLKK